MKSKKNIKNHLIHYFSSESKKINNIQSLELSEEKEKRIIIIIKLQKPFFVNLEEIIKQFQYKKLILK